MNGFIIFFIFSLIIFLISLAVTLFGGIWPFDGTVKPFAELGRKVRGENCRDSLGYFFNLIDQDDLSCSDVFSDHECSENMKDCSGYESEDTCKTKTLDQYYTNLESRYLEKVTDGTIETDRELTQEDLDKMKNDYGCMYVEKLRDWDKVFKGIFE